MRVALVLLFSAVSLWAADKPNFLVIMADDCTYNDLPLYGGQNAKTPNIDKLATQGLVFNNAYLATAMCQPCRAEMYTGLYPFSNGCSWNHSSSLSTIRSMPTDLNALGYRVGIAGKVHVKPKSVFPFEEVAGLDKSCVRNPTQTMSTDGIKAFIGRNNQEPFCLVACLVDPHLPWVMGDPSQYPPKKIKLPANIVDTERTRQDFSKYLAEITYMDGQVGEIVKVLEDSGQADNTLLIFTSEQGSQFPGCKWTNFNTGVHTAFIARWPGKTPVGKRTDALIQYADVLPTFMQLAGGKADGYDGSSFHKALTDETAGHRTYVYGSHNNLPEGPPYPIRSVTDGKYHYIRNLLPEEIYIEKHLMGMKSNAALNNPYWGSWMANANKPEVYKLIKRYMKRPAEQLFISTEDPYELNNVIDSPEYAKQRAELSAELDRWMKAQGDPGAAQDTHKVYGAAKKGAHIHKP
jgi:uncharacterized sulfatase